MRRWIAPLSLALLVSTQANAYVDVDHAVDEIENGVMIIDARNDNDFNAGNVHNSLQVDMTIRPLSDEIDTRSLAYQLRRVVDDKNQTVVIYSDTDENANKAEAALRKVGFLDIVNGGNYEGLKAALFRLCQKEYWFC